MRNTIETGQLVSIEANGDALLRVSELSVKYRLEDSEVLALDNVNLTIRKNGHTIGLVGESGSGKSTFGASLMNLIEPPGFVLRGNISFGGKNVLEMSNSDLRKYRWSQVSMIYQSAMNSLNPVKKVYDPIAEVIREHTGASKSSAKEQALKLLGEVGFPINRADDYPHQLSGGMKQRVVIALALALSPNLLIADEPTSALDVVTQHQVLSLLNEQVSSKKLSMIFITHEISLLSGLVQDVVVMHSGEIVEIGPTEKVLTQPLHPYTEMLIKNLLTAKSDKSLLNNWQRSESSEEKLPERACLYSNECLYAFEKCRNERPKLIEVEQDRWVSCHRRN